MSKSWIERHGRKFALAVIAMTLAFLLSLVGLYAIAKAPGQAVSIADIIGAFALSISVAVGVFNGANAAIEWKRGGPQVQSSVTRETKVTAVQAAPVQRAVDGEPLDPSGG